MLYITSGLTQSAREPSCVPYVLCNIFEKEHSNCPLSRILEVDRDRQLRADLNDSHPFSIAASISLAYYRFRSVKHPPYKKIRKLPILFINAARDPPMKDNTKPFALAHPWDRNFFLVMAVLAWLGIVMGFGGDIANHLANHESAYPLIVHFHAFVFVGWLTLFTAQILLIRLQKLPIHRQLGMVMVGVAVAMAILGPATALTVQHHGMNQPHADPAFLSIQFTDILAFVGLVTVGVLLRRVPNAHKRLMLLATLYITDAGYARWLLSEGLMQWLGNGYWPMWVVLYCGPNILILGAGAYDLTTRRRLHPAYLVGAAWVFANQMMALVLYSSPSWQVFAKKIIAHWPF